MAILKYFYCCALITLVCSLLSAQYTEEVDVQIEKGTSFGTLTVADSLHQSPVILLIAGSGPTDRNMGEGNAYKMLSDSLAKYGISSLRYDKRSSGETVKTLLDYDDISFDLLVDDAKAWIDFLKADSRFSSITIVGHSQGSLVGMLAAQNTPTDKFVSLAGPAEKADVVIKKQIYEQPGNKFFFGNYIDSIFTEIGKGHIVDSIPPIFQSLFSKKVQPFLNSWMQYVPTDEIKKLKIPTLIVHGEMDFQVRKEQFDFLKNAMPSADTLVVDNMNHAMRFADTFDKMENAKNYTDPNEGLVPNFVDRLASFIKEE